MRGSAREVSKFEAAMARNSAAKEAEAEKPERKTSVSKDMDTFKKDMDSFEPPARAPPSPKTNGSGSPKKDSKKEATSPRADRDSLPKPGKVPEKSPTIKKREL